MKKNAVPELNAAWWSKNQPQGLSTAKELEKTLVGYETAKAALGKDADAQAHEACVQAIDELARAAAKVKAETDKAIKSPPKDPKFDADDFDNTSAALKKLGAALDAARREADAQRDEAIRKSFAEYHDYLKNWLKKVKDGPLNFAFAVGAKPAAHRIAFHRTTSGDVLEAKLKRDTRSHKVCNGTAMAHEVKKDVLVLALDKAPLSGLAKKTRNLFRLFKLGLYTQVQLRLNGSDIDDIVDPEDPEVDEPLLEGEALDERGGEEASDVEARAETAETASAQDAPHAGDDTLQVLAQLQARLKSLAPAISAALAAAPAAKEQILRLVAAAKKALQAEQLAETKQALAELSSVLKSAGSDGKSTAGIGPAAISAAFRKQWPAVSQQWQRASASVGGQLAQLQKLLDSDDDEELEEIADAGLESCIAEFTTSMDRSLAAIERAGDALSDDALRDVRSLIADFQTHIAKDERVIACDENPFGVMVSIRPTLGAALTEMDKALQSAMAA